MTGVNDPQLRRLLTGMLDPQLATIGTIGALWNRIERSLVGCIWVAAGWDQETGELVTADLGNVERATLLMNLVARAVTDDRRIVEQTRIVLSLYDTMRSARNDLMHGFFNWSRRDANTLNKLFKFSAKRRSGVVEAKAAPVDQHALDKLLADLMLCHEGLNDLMHKLHFRRRFLDGERGPLASDYENAVHGWRALPFDPQSVRECLERRNPPAPDPLAAVITGNIARLAAERGLSVEEVTKRAGLKPGSLPPVAGRLGVRRTKAIAKVLGVEANEIVDERA